MSTQLKKTIGANNYGVRSNAITLNAERNNVERINAITLFLLPLHP